VKEKLLIYQGDPCLMALDDPAVQTVEEAQARGQTQCKFYSDRRSCSPPRFGCIKLAGFKVARNVLQIYGEASEQNLTIELEHFSQTGPLPPEQLEAYMDTVDYGCRHITDPGLVFQRVAEYARKVLDLKPGERVLRCSGDSLFLPSPPKTG